VLVEVGGKTELVIGVVGKVLGLDPDTGKQLWSSAGINNYMCPTPAVGDGVVYFTGGRDRTTWAVKAGGRGDVSGTHELWRVRKGSNVTSPVLYEGRLYVVSDVQEILYCFDAKTGNNIFEERMNRFGGMFASPVIAGGKLYCTSQHGGTTYVINAGPRYEELSRNTFGERVRSNATPAVSGGRLLIRTDQHLYCIGE
jgi:outer membrane protein assembly factor BamB